MDRLPRDIAAEKMHQDILQMLDEYRVTSPGSISLRNGIPTSPNELHAFMHQHKPKSNKRRNKNNTHMKEHLGYSPDGVKSAAPRKSKSKKKNSAVHSNGQNGESSSMGTLSPGEGVESPSGYDMAPPTYDNVCGGQGNMVGLRHPQMNGLEDARNSCAQMSNRMDDHCVMSNHYKNEPRLDPRIDMIKPVEWLTMPPQVSMSQSPIAMAASIPTPPSTNSSHNSPLGMDGKHSPMKGKVLPTSPPHYYAVHNMKSPIHYQLDYTFDHQQQQQPIGRMDMSHHTSMPPYTAMYDSRQKMSTPRQIQTQYPTPPSQHSYLGLEAATPPQGLNTLPENILTPSPDSPGHWSSSSPHSAQSDWSEGISSPVPPIGQHHKGRMHNAADAPVYI